MGSDTSKESTVNTDKIEGDKTQGGFNFGVVHSNFHSGGWCILIIITITILIIGLLIWFKKKYSNDRRIQNPKSHQQYPEYGFLRQIRNSFRTPRSSDQVNQNPEWCPAQQTVSTS